MKRTKLPTVLILYGGMGAEHDISVLGKEYIDKRIDRGRFFAVSACIDKSGEWYAIKNGKKRRVHPINKNGKSGLLLGKRFLKIDTVFPILHGDFGEDGRVQGLLECLGFSFVGCNTLSGAISIDKGITKAVAERLCIPTVPWVSVNGEITKNTLIKIEEHLPYPVFVKPTCLGSSIGAGVAHDREELFDRLRIASELGQGRVLAEEYLKSKRELECAYLELAGERFFTPPGEIRCDGGFYSFEEKYSCTSRASVLSGAPIDSDISDKVTAYAKALADELGLRGLARIDFFLDGDKLYFNEINTMPGLTDASLYPRLIEKHYPGCDFLNRLIEESLL